MSVNRRRDIRRRAMQVLYQLGLEPQAQPDRDALRAALDADLHDGDGQDDDPAVCEAALDLALAAWADHNQADASVTELTPDWPTHRQPPVDRAILRLAHHEMTTARVPLKVAINEAVELAKAFGAENSPAFVNGVLDKLAKQTPGSEDDSSSRTVSDEAWLDDAVQS